MHETVAEGTMTHAQHAVSEARVHETGQRTVKILQLQ